MVIFFPLWIWFCYRKALKRQILTAILVLIIFVVGGYFFVNLVEQSSMGERLTLSWETITGTGYGQREGSTAARMAVAQIAFNVMLEHPLTGIGLANLGAYTPHGLSGHSDYVEVGANTGFPGFFLYFSIYAILWYRAGRIRKYSQDASIVRTAGLVRTLVLVILITDLGNTYYYDKATWAAVAGFIGYTNAVWHQMRLQMGSPVPAGAIGPASPMLVR